MDRRVYLLFLVLPLLAVLTAASAFADMVTVTGKIMGAACVTNQTPCPKGAGDPQVAMERDFVLLAEDGSAYFLPNMTRISKQSLVNEEVVVVGNVKGTSMFVANVDKMMMGGMVSVWNWDRNVRNLRFPR